MPTSDGRPSNPFQVLGLALSADDREVRSAYARKLREARLAGGQDLVQEIQDAFVALRDAEKRGQIRQFLEKQAEVEPLLAGGRERLEEGKPVEALACFLSALELLPDQESLLRNVVEIELSLRRLDAAADHAGRLIEVAPHEPGHHALLAVVLGTKAQFTTESVVRIGKWRAAHQAVRQAQELGGGGAPLTLLQSQVLWNLRETSKAEAVLLASLDPVTELKTGELTQFIALLRLQILRGSRSALTQTLDRLRTLIPDDPARRVSIGGELRELAEESGLHHPREARACLELAAQACPEDPSIGRALAACGLRQEEIKKKAAQIGELATRPVSSDRRVRGWFGWKPTYYFFAAIAITALNLTRMCSRHDPAEFRPERVRLPIDMPVEAFPPKSEWKLRAEDVIGSRKKPEGMPGLSTGGPGERPAPIPPAASSLPTKGPSVNSGNSSGAPRAGVRGAPAPVGGGYGSLRPDGGGSD